MQEMRQDIGYKTKGNKTRQWKQDKEQEIKKKIIIRSA